MSEGLLGIPPYPVLCLPNRTEAGFRSYAQQKGKKKVHIYAPSAILLCICNEMLRRRNKKEIESPLRKKCISNPTLSTCAILLLLRPYRTRLAPWHIHTHFPFSLLESGTRRRGCSGNSHKAGKERYSLQHDRPENKPNASFEKYAAHALHRNCKNWRFERTAKKSAVQREKGGQQKQSKTKQKESIKQKQTFENWLWLALLPLRAGWQQKGKG